MQFLCYICTEFIVEGVFFNFKCVCLVTGSVTIPI